jgi:hypothetical protein
VKEANMGAIVVCLMLLPMQDTADARLSVYQEQPKAQFCYKWSRHLDTRRRLFKTCFKDMSCKAEVIEAPKPPLVPIRRDKQ